MLCYILDSSRPICQVELTDCGMIIGTNALDELGFSIVDCKGNDLESFNAGKTLATEELTDAVSIPSEESSKVWTVQPEMPVDVTGVLAVMLAQDVHLRPQQTRVDKARLNRDNSAELKTEIGVVTPAETLMTNKQCDFMEGYWTDDVMSHLLLLHLPTGRTSQFL